MAQAAAFIAGLNACVPAASRIDRYAPAEPQFFSVSIVLMVTSVAYNPAQWDNFFILVGTGSATLAGLVFVAMTINLKGVVKDATHRYRAVNMLTGFTSVFILSSLALMGHQTYRTVGIEWLIVSLLAAAINTNGYVQAFRLPGSLYALSLFRMAGGSACYLGQIIGSFVLLFSSSAGIYIGAVALIVNFSFLVSGSWLLILGTLHSPDDSPV